MSKYSEKVAAKKEVVLKSLQELTVPLIDFTLINDEFDVQYFPQVAAKIDYNTLRDQGYLVAGQAKTLMAEADRYGRTAAQLLSLINVNYDAWKKANPDRQQIVHSLYSGEGVTEFYNNIRRQIHDLIVMGDESLSAYESDLKNFRDVEGADKNLVDMLFWMADDKRKEASEEFENADALFKRADEILRDAGLGKIVDERKEREKTRANAKEHSASAK